MGAGFLFLLLFGVAVGFSSLCPSGWEILENGRTVCLRIEESGNGYFRVEERFSFQGSLFEGRPLEDRYELFRSGLGYGLGSNASACGLNVFANYLYGIKTNIKALERFIRNWSESLPAVALYALATYLPVAKEVLLGVEMMSNAVAQLKGFSCQRVMNLIRQMNYTDSVLVRNCVVERLRARYPGLTEADYDTLMNIDPDEWWDAYNYCLNRASFSDLISPKIRNWLESNLNLRRNLWCAFWDDKANLKQVIAELPDMWDEGGLSERAKIIAFAMLPGFELSVGEGRSEVASIEIGGWELGEGGEASRVNIRRLVDSMLRRELPADLSVLVDSALEAYMRCTGGGDCPSAISSLEEEIEKFERKWNVDMDRILDELELIARIEALLYKQKEAGDPTAGRALAEFLMTLQSTYVKKLQRQIYLEVRKQILEQFDHAIAYLRTKKNLGSGVGCPS